MVRAEFIAHMGYTFLKRLSRWFQVKGEDVSPQTVNPRLIYIRSSPTL
jgi:hypothetical protein